MSFALSFLQSSPGIITERCSGLWNRLIVAGVTNRQLLFFHFFEALLISLIQYCELVIYVLFELNAFTWDLLVTVILLIFLNGIAGIAAGILTSLLSRTVTESIYAGQMVLFPSLFLCGE